MSEIGDRLAAVQERIAKACIRVWRKPESVTLIAAAKKQSEDRIRAAIEAGQRDFGENYVQELEQHRALFADPLLQWHLIGHLQSNKAKKAVQLGAFIHTVDSAKLAHAIGQAHPGLVPLAALIEVNLAGEASKSGVAPEEVEAIARAMFETKRVLPVGLMTIPPADMPARPWFVLLRKFRDDLSRKLEWELPALSMGMSDDFEEAIEEGATMVRVGTAIFGARGG